MYKIMQGVEKADRTFSPSHSTWVHSRSFTTSKFRFGKGGHSSVSTINLLGLSLTIVGDGHWLRELKSD